MATTPWKMEGSSGMAWRVMLTRGPITAPSRPTDCRKPSATILWEEGMAQALVTVGTQWEESYSRGNIWLGQEMPGEEKLG